MVVRALWGRGVVPLVPVPLVPVALAVFVMVGPYGWI